MEFSIEHINYFSPQSLTALMSGYGFDTVSLKQVCYDAENANKYYVIRGVFQKREVAKIIDLEFDMDTIIGLMNYMMTSKSAEDYTLQIINMLVEDETPIIVWGVGSHTLRLLAISELKKAKIVAFVDSNVNYCGKMLNGIPILLPKEIINRDELILISTRVYQNKIVNEIKNELKLENKIITLFRE
jgi:FlaA1/EpsC-like NDP-sugar epimerase